MTYAKTRSLDTWLLFITALLVIGAGIGLRDPWPADEPRFTLVAKHMVESGDWLFPHRGVELYSDKPPMLMWLEGLFFLLTGNWRVAFLMPSLLATLGAIWCVKDLGQRLWTRKVGLYAGWALLFAFQFTYQAKRAQIDALVLGMITLANYGLLRHLLKGPDWKTWVLGWFFAGLGTITKGVGFLALLSIVPAAVVSARGWPGVKVWAGDRRFWLGPLAFLVAVSIWLVPMVATVLLSGDPEHRAYLNDILLRQTAKRYARSWDHPQPWWYFLQVLLMWAPTILALPWAIAPWARRLRLRRDPRYLVPLAWWLIVMVFFSIPHGKRDVYIMPALPMLCLALAPLLPGLLRRRDVRGVLHAFTAVLVLATLGMGIAMLTGEPSFERGLHRDRDPGPGRDPCAGLGPGGDRHLGPGQPAGVLATAGGGDVLDPGRDLGAVRDGGVPAAQRFQLRARSDARGGPGHRSAGRAGPGGLEGAEPAHEPVQHHHLRLPQAVEGPAARGSGLAGAGTAAALAAGPGHRPAGLHRSRRGPACGAGRSPRLVAGADGRAHGLSGLAGDSVRRFGAQGAGRGPG